MRLGVITCAALVALTLPIAASADHVPATLAVSAKLCKKTG